jgi:molybdopterin-guanine dinucleotide biosynthesis protein A
LYGLLLAGGQSRRMGSDKALLVRDGKSQLEHVATMLGEVCDRVFVEQIVDRYQEIGPVAGILSAMDEYPDVDWLVVACDLPNVDAQTLDFLLEHRSRDLPFTAFRSSYDDLPEPLCAVYRSTSDRLVRQFVDDGITCPRKILIRSDTLLLEQPNSAALDNVNTPDDLETSILEMT